MKTVVFCLIGSLLPVLTIARSLCVIFIGAISSKNGTQSVHLSIHFGRSYPLQKKKYLQEYGTSRPSDIFFTEYITYKFPFRRGYRSIGKTRKSNPAKKIFNSFYIPYFSKNFFLVWFDFRATPPFLFLRIFSLCYCAPAGKEN